LHWEDFALHGPIEEPQDKIANAVHQLLKQRAIDKSFDFKESLLSVGLTSLEMTSLTLSVEADFAIQIPDRVITPANFASVTTIGRLVRDLTARTPSSASGDSSTEQQSSG
jgi:acyl carrier protein